MMNIDSLLKQIETGDFHNPLANLQDQDLRDEIMRVTAGAVAGDEKSCSEFHHYLAILNKHRLSLSVARSPQADLLLNSICTYMEIEWLNRERERISPLLSGMPDDEEGFVRWFEQLQQNGPGQHHPLFDYLAEQATREELRYFLLQEMGTEAGFDDLISLTQVKTPPSVKLELARNYWDEMGGGELEGMHSELLSRLVGSFQLSWEDYYEDVHWAPLALSNLMIAFAMKRAYFSQSIGALGVIELTAPERCLRVMEGMKRVKLRDDEYKYYALHSLLDQEHWAGWKMNVMRPLIREYPERMVKMAEGALLRLFAGARCFEVYCNHLKLQFDSYSDLLQIH
jgi:hypothetical protein